MKRSIICFIVGLLLIGTTACTKKATTASLPQQAQTITVVPEDMDSMIQPIDSLVCFLSEYNETYHSEDAEFFWNTLCYFLGEYASENKLVSETEDGKLQIPKKVAQEYAIALFANYKELLPLPETLSNLVTYDEGYDAYFLVKPEYSPTKTIFSSCIQTDRASIVSVKLVSNTNEEEVLGEWIVSMQKNVFADGMETPKYLYSIATITPVNELLVPPQAASGTYNGLSDSHTVEVALDDGTVQAYQFSEPAVSQKLHKQTEGNSFSFVYYSDEPSGALKILTIN